MLLLAYQDESFDEIGRLLNMPSATVRSHNRRGRCKLLSYLMDRHAELLGGQAAIAAAWGKVCHATDSSERPSAEEQEAWAGRKAGARPYCGAVLKLARYLQLAAWCMGIMLGAKK